LSEAGAQVVAFDVRFAPLDTTQHRGEASPTGEAVPADTGKQLVSWGTERLADAIVEARRRGTSVVIAAGERRVGQATTASEAFFPAFGFEFGTAPRILEALSQPLDASQSVVGSGYVANPCLSTLVGSGAVQPTLLATHPEQPHHAGLALAAVSSFWGKPSLAVDPEDRTLYLSGTGAQEAVEFAGFGAETQAVSCTAMVSGDRQARQIVDLSTRYVVRGDPAAIPFEQLILGESLPDLSGKLVLLGEQRHLAEPSDTGELADGHNVLHCDTPGLCGRSERWGVNIHLSAIIDLLQLRAIRPLDPLAQLALLLALC
jgi:hypothetical protein